MVLIEELRIGNLVYGVSDRVERVGGIIEDQIKSKPYLSMFDENWTDVKHISYVPLTDKWLLNFGFERKLVFYHYEDTMPIYNCEEGKFWLNAFGNDIEINSVHYLQNLYYNLLGYDLILKDK